MHRRRTSRKETARPVTDAVLDELAVHDVDRLVRARVAVSGNRGPASIRVMTVIAPVAGSWRNTFIDTPGKSSGVQSKVAVSSLTSYIAASSAE